MDTCMYTAFAHLAQTLAVKSSQGPLTEYEVLAYESICRMVQTSAELMRRNLENAMPKEKEAGE